MALNEDHTKSIVEYLRFMRYKRAQRVRVIEASFQELKESRCVSSIPILSSNFIFSLNLTLSFNL